MSDHDHRPRDNDHLVEPIYEALKRERESEQEHEPSPAGGRIGCLLLLPLALAWIVRRAVEY